MFDGVSGAGEEQCSRPIVSGVPVFLVVRIDLNANPAVNDAVTVYFDPTPGFPFRMSLEFRPTDKSILPGTICFA